MAAPFPKLNFLDNLILNLFHMAPSFLRGVLISRPFWYGLFARWHGDPVSVRVLDRLRRKYASHHLDAWILDFKWWIFPRITRTLLVLDHDSIREIWEDPATFAVDPRAKKERLSLFQPDGLILSSGKLGEARRKFNEAVLDTPCKKHQFAVGFLGIVRQELAKTVQNDKLQLTWAVFSSLAESITLRVVHDRSQ